MPVIVPRFQLEHGPGQGATEMAGNLADGALHVVHVIMEAVAFTRTPVFQAIMGFFGTMVTGFVLSLIAAAFLRKKD